MHTDNPHTTNPNTNRVLVVLNPDDPDTTLQAVVRETGTSDAEFHLLVVFPTAEYEARRRARIDAGVTAPYTLDSLAEEGRRIARRVGRGYLGPDGIEPMGAVGDTPDCIRRAVQTDDYSRIYVTERPHSIWQRLLGVETLSAELTRVLPDVVSVVTVDDGVGSSSGSSDPDAVLDPTTESTTRAREP